MEDDDDDEANNAEDEVIDEVPTVVRCLLLSNPNDAGWVVLLTYFEIDWLSLFVNTDCRGSFCDCGSNCDCDCDCDCGCGCGCGCDCDRLEKKGER